MLHCVHLRNGIASQKVGPPTPLPAPLELGAKTDAQVSNPLLGLPGHEQWLVVEGPIKQVQVFCKLCHALFKLSAISKH